MLKNNPILYLIKNIKLPIFLIISAIIISIIGSIFQLLLPLFTQNLIDNFSMFIENKYFILIFIIVFLLSGVLNGLSIYLLTKIGEGIIYVLIKKVWFHILKLKPSFFNRNENGQLLSRIIDDSNILNNFITQTIPTFFPSLITLFGSTILLFTLDWQTAFVALVSIPLYVALIVPLSNIMQKIAYQTQLETARLSGVISHVLSEINLIKISNSEFKEFNSTLSKLQRLYSLGVKEGTINAVVTPVTTLIMLISMGGVLAFGGLRVSSGAISPGTLIALIFYLMQLTDPVEHIANIFTGYKKTKGASVRLTEIMKEPEESLEFSKDIQKINSSSIAFEKVNFSYEKGVPVLKDCSFSIPKNKMTALVGPSGSGKTTIFNIIARLYEINSGSIKYGEKSIYEYSLAEWRNHIGYVMQNNGVINGTIKKNISYALKYKPKLSEVEYYANLANANTFIEKLQKQYNTLTGETGIQLSGGEKQRLDIARNFIKRPGLLLLDEATSNLDSESEKKIQDALSNIAKERTTIIIAHRLSTVLQADQIIFVDNGFITGTGTHKELMNSHQKYKKMIELQSLN
ncbi:ABC transporter ATP-binding protein [Staphylococcus saprophyticus]|uniref:ABC transporter ATP-binding protein n=1 Tax=Staphylococcus saprophyticus TaxID=29385 RepID=UPI0018878A82|nr:ABC transporter ATP-binding protein [Staphylococcus saprophyticus]MBF2782499.1 ABC transporter ATP-binding protein [Staphylococcus saprophyticus]